MYGGKAGRPFFGSGAARLGQWSLGVAGVVASRGAAEDCTCDFSGFPVGSGTETTGVLGETLGDKGDVTCPNETV